MLIPFMISKIHNATVTGAEPNYSGSILIDADLMAQCGLRAYQKVEVYNITNGHRLATHHVIHNLVVAHNGQRVGARLTVGHHPNDALVGVQAGRGCLSHLELGIVNGPDAVRRQQRVDVSRVNRRGRR